MKTFFNKVKKEDIIYISLFIMVIIAILYSMFKDKKASLYYDKTYDQDTPIIIKNNNKVGYISAKNGRILIDSTYIEGERFYGDYAVVKISKNNNEYYRIIDKNNIKKIEFETFTPYEYISEYNLWLIDGILYDNNFMPINSKKNKIEYILNGLFTYKNISSNKSGVINHKNQKLFEFSDSNIEINKNNIAENIIVVKSNNNYYLCNINNKKILYKVKSNEYIMELINNNAIKLTSKDNKQRYIIFSNDEIIYETIDSLEDVQLVDDYIIFDYGYNYNNKNKKQRYYYYDIKASKLIKEKPDIKKSNINEYGYELIVNNNKIGIKKDNKTILESKYNEIEFLQKDLFDYIKYFYDKELVLLYNKSEVNLYDLKNNKVIETFIIKGNDYIKNIPNTPYFKIKKYNEDDKSSLTLYNIITKKSMEFNDYDSFYAGTNYIVIKKNNKNFYYNSKFQMIYESK